MLPGVITRIWATVAVVLGIALIVISADKFVEGMKKARFTTWHEPFFTGLTIVSIGTSAPELSCRCRSLDGSPVALGNALGQTLPISRSCLGSQHLYFRYSFQNPVARTSFTHPYLSRV